MTDLFALTDLAAFLDQDVDTATATLCRDMATGVLQAATGQHLLPVTGDVVTLLPLRRDITLTLPERPVTAVTSVSVAGNSPIVGWTWDGDRTIYSYYQFGWQSYWGAFYPRNLPKTIPVQVTYDHGYTVIPLWLKAVSIKVGGHLYENPQLLKTVTIDDYTAQYVSENGVLDPTDLQMIRHAGTRSTFSIRTS